MGYEGVELETLGGVAALIGWGVMNFNGWVSGVGHWAEAKAKAEKEKAEAEALAKQQQAEAEAQAKKERKAEKNVRNTGDTSSYT